MATPDHTALARPPNPLGGKPIQSFGRPFHVMDTVVKSRQHVALQLASISRVIDGVKSLIAISDAGCLDRNCDLPSRCGGWPLAEVHKENLLAATCFLNQYAELLSLETLMEP